MLLPRSAASIVTEKKSNELNTITQTKPFPLLFCVNNHGITAIPAFFSVWVYWSFSLVVRCSVGSTYHHSGGRIITFVRHPTTNSISKLRYVTLNPLESVSLCVNPTTTKPYSVKMKECTLCVDKCTTLPDYMEALKMKECTTLCVDNCRPWKINMRRPILYLKYCLLTMEFRLANNWNQ